MNQRLNKIRSTKRANWLEKLSIDQQSIAGRSSASGIASRPKAGAFNRHHGIGWEALHVCIDDATRLSHSEIPGGRTQGQRGGLSRSRPQLVRGAGGVAVERVMTDNGSAYPSTAVRAAVAAAGLKHKRTRPYAPRANGKAERCTTSLRECAYARPDAGSQKRRTSA
jgi:hypothetical protein